MARKVQANESEKIRCEIKEHHWGPLDKLYAHHEI